jgi:hypothetical protein
VGPAGLPSSLFGGRCFSFPFGKENAMLPLMIGMGLPVFAVIAYALTRPDPGEVDRRAGA